MSENYLPKEDEADKPFVDLTKELFEYLKIPREELYKGSETERVKQMLIILAGTMGIGKTTLVKKIIKELTDYYSADEVNAVYSQVSTEVLLEYAFRGNPYRNWNSKKPVQVIVYDDATSVKLTSKDQQQFCKLRHKMMEETGLKEGIIYSILVTHDWYRLDSNFRRNAIVTCFLSVSPLDRYSRREYSKFIGEKGVTFLSERLGKALRLDEFKGEGLVVLPPEGLQKRVGLVKWKPLQEVKYIEIKETKDKRLVFKER